MIKVDYDQVAEYEAARELLTVFQGICLSLEKKYPKYAKYLTEKHSEVTRIKQILRIENNKTVKEIIDVYGKFTREYFNKDNDFKLTPEFFNIKVKV